jgi:hypothetical protein
MRRRMHKMWRSMGLEGTGLLCVPRSSASSGLRCALCRQLDGIGRAVVGLLVFCSYDSSKVVGKSPDGGGPTFQRGGYNVVLGQMGGVPTFVWVRWSLTPVAMTDAIEKTDATARGRRASRVSYSLNRKVESTFDFPID